MIINSSDFAHVADQYPADIRRNKYKYWTKLISASKDYTNETGNIPKNNPESFIDWMKDRWGLDVHMIDGNYSAYYTVVNEKKYMLFEIKYDRK